MTTPKLTLTNLKAPLAAGTGKPAVKTTAAFWPEYRAAMTALERYRTSPPVAANPYGRNPDRADGFNYAWYAKVRPDVVAAGVDPLRHWLDAGRFEGSPPYEGGPTAVDWTAMSPEDCAKLPAPPLEMRDMYFPAGIQTVYATVRLGDVGGRRPWRTFEAKLVPDRGPDDHPQRQGLWYYHPEFRQSDTVFGAHNDWTITTEIDIIQDKPGVIGIYLHGGTSSPQLGDNGQRKVWLFVGIEPPTGYVHPPRAPKLAKTIAPVPKKWDIVEDFLGPLDSWHSGQYDLNGALGLMCGPDTTSLRGYKPFADTLPIVDGVRRMKIVDLGPNPDTDDRVLHAGQAYRYLMPKLMKMLGDGVNYYMEMDLKYPMIQGLDPGVWYWDQKELDHLEIWPRDRTHTASFHMLDGRMPTYNPFGDATLRRTLCILRQHDPKGGPGRYAQWQRMEGETEKRLIIDGPNYMGDTPFPLQFTFEGPGGSVGGRVDPNIKYGDVYGELHSVKYQQL